MSEGYGGVGRLLGCCSNQDGGGIYRGVIEVDLFDEADSQLVISKPNMFGGVDARVAMLTEPPMGERAES